MTYRPTDTRHAKLVDYPLVKRLAVKGIVLDTELACTRENSSGGLFLPRRGLYTLVTRTAEHRVVGQFRLKPDEHLAQIVFLAPNLEQNDSDTAWLHILDAMAAEAGRRGAHILTGEVDEMGPLFQTMRTAGFSVYARQEIWRRAPGQPLLGDIVPAVLTEETDADAMDIQLLYCNIVPRLVQQIAVPAPNSAGLVYRQQNRIQGYVAISEGKYGVYMVPFLHPDILFNEASAVIAGALEYSSRSEKLPVYVCVRRYQDWLDEAVIEMGFERYSQQAVMVRHIAAGVRHTAFAPLSHALEVIPAPIRPPTSQMIESVCEWHHQE